MVSKYFGGPSGFAVDLKPDFLVVQGYVWFLKTAQPADGEGEDEVALPVADLLCAYTAIMNSRPFGSVLEIFSPHVAGGQFNLSPRYVGHIPIPDLVDLAREERTGRLISRLVELGPRTSLY